MPKNETILLLQGKATDHIWALEDGPRESPIGLRVDCGDSGVLYLNKSQAKDIIEALQYFLEDDFITEPSRV